MNDYKLERFDGGFQVWRTNDDGVFEELIANVPNWKNAQMIASYFKQIEFNRKQL